MQATADDTAQPAWHLPTAPAISTREVLALAARIAAVTKPLQVLPGWAARALALVVPVLREMQERRYQLDEPDVFDSGRFMRRFADFRITPLEEGLTTTLRALRAQRGQAQHQANV